MCLHFSYGPPLCTKEEAELSSSAKMAISPTVHSHVMIMCAKSFQPEIYVFDKRAATET